MRIAILQLRHRSITQIKWHFLNIIHVAKFLKNKLESVFIQGNSLHLDHEASIIRQIYEEVRMSHP